MPVDDRAFKLPGGSNFVIDWEGILREHGPAVWRTAYRLVANRADADECFQETFADAVGLVRGNPQQPIRQWKALLVKLAAARAVDRLRQRVRRNSREDAGADVAFQVDRTSHNRPPEQAEQAELSASLRIALAHLPPKQADVFYLHALEGWTYREVAEHLKMSVDDVGVSLHRARAALRERLASIAMAPSGQARLRPGTPRSGEVSHES
jgi:RNA polymerase sigma-70 factor (ECF subfamily)